MTSNDLGPNWAELGRTNGNLLSSSAAGTVSADRRYRAGRTEESTKTAEPPHTLYRFWNSEGALLYIGLTDHPLRRWSQHSKSKSWWHQVAGITIEHFDTRNQLNKAERAAIKAERPLHNITHNGAKRNPTPLNTYAVLSHCNGTTSRHNYMSRQDAETALARINQMGCGGRCTRNHHIEVQR